MRIHWFKSFDIQLLNFLLSTGFISLFRFFTSLFFLKTFIYLYPEELHKFNTYITTLSFFYSASTLSAGNIIVNRFKGNIAELGQFKSLFYLTLFSTSVLFLILVLKSVFYTSHPLELSISFLLFPNLLLHYLHAMNNATLKYNQNNISLFLGFLILIIFTYFLKFTNLSASSALMVYAVILSLGPLILLILTQKTYHRNLWTEFTKKTSFNFSAFKSNFYSLNFITDIIYFLIYSSNLMLLYYLVKEVIGIKSDVFEVYFRFITISVSVLSALLTSYIIPALNLNVRNFNKSIPILIVSNLFLTVLYIPFVLLFLNLPIRFISVTGLFLIFMKLFQNTALSLCIFYRLYYFVILLILLEMFAIVLFLY